jgi:hypothetical protein
MFRPCPRQRACHAGYPVCTAIEGRGYAGVPKKVLDRFRVDAVSRKQCRASVPEIVPTDRGRSARLRRGLK